MSIKFLTWLTTYIIIILCELGDKTQVAVLLFTSSNPRKKWTIFIASSLALVLCVVVEVTVGLSLARYIGPDIVNKFAGGAFILLGLIGFLKHYRYRIGSTINQKIMMNTNNTTKSAEAEI